MLRALRLNPSCRLSWPKTLVVRWPYLETLFVHVSVGHFGIGIYHVRFMICSFPSSLAHESMHCKKKKKKMLASFPPHPHTILGKRWKGVRFAEAIEWYRPYSVHSCTSQKKSTEKKASTLASTTPKLYSVPSSPFFFFFPFFFINSCAKNERFLYSTAFNFKNVKRSTCTRKTKRIASQFNPVKLYFTKGNNVELLLKAKLAYSNYA